MRCPKCGRLDDKVIDSRASREGSVIRRRRECLSCSHRFTTYEEIEHEGLMVVKRDGPSMAIGERVMEGLRDIDDVAYVRFASVYRRFQEATDFVQAVKTLEEQP